MILFVMVELGCLVSRTHFLHFTRADFVSLQARAHVHRIKGMAESHLRLSKNAHLFC